MSQEIESNKKLAMISGIIFLTINGIYSIYVLIMLISYLSYYSGFPIAILIVSIAITYTVVILCG